MKARKMWINNFYVLGNCNFLFLQFSHNSKCNCIIRCKQRLRKLRLSQ